MRKSILIVAAGVFLSMGAAHLRAQEPASEQTAQAGEETDMMKWKLINTAIFAALLGFGVLKLAPKFFQARSLDIQKAIKESTGLKIDADFRYSEIDKKMANLSGEVARMKNAAAAEMDREHQRMLRDTEEEIQHLGRNSDFEIDSLRVEGMLQVKRHTAQLAFGLAERRLQAHFAQNDDQNNVQEFAALVGSGS